MTKLIHGKYTGGWWEENNRRRRERYKNDPEYREQVKKANRLSQRAKNPDSNEKFKGYQRLSESKLSDWGTYRYIIRPDGTCVNRLTFTKKELRELLGDFSQPIVYGWVSRGMIPQPAYRYRSGGYARQTRVYTDLEVVQLVTALNTHFNVDKYRYLHKDHTSFIEEVKVKFRYARNMINGEG